MDMVAAFGWMYQVTLTFPILINHIYPLMNSRLNSRLT